MKKIFITLFVLSIAFVTLQSQTRRSSGGYGKNKIQTYEIGHSFHFGMGAGFSGLYYPLQYGSVKPSYGLTADIKYTYFFKSWFGLSTGLSFSSFKANAQLTDEISFHNQYDTENIPYIHKVNFVDWEEQQELYTLSITLELNFRYKKKGSKIGVYSNVGFNITFPVNSSYKTAGQAIHSGYYPQWDLLLEDITNRFGADKYFSTNGDLDFKQVNLFLSAELGMPIQITPKMDLTVGIYATYCLHDATGKRYTNRRDIGFASDFSNFGDIMVEYQGLIGTNIVGDIHPWNCGIKIGIQYSLEQYSEQEKERQKKRAAKEAKKLAELSQKHDTIYIEKSSIRDTIYLLDTIYLDKPKSASEEVLNALETILQTSVIWFKFDDYNPILEPSYILDSVASILKQNDNIIVYINGHSCDIGTDKYNENLALERAEAVAEILIDEYEVSESQIIIQSFGSTHPFKYNGKHQRSRDRRVEIIPFIKE